MGVHYTRTGGGSVGGGSFRQAAKRMQSIYAEELRRAGEEGEAEAKAYIEIAGTQSVWSGVFKGRSGPNSGRIDSGAMRDAVTMRVNTGGNSVSVDVGWIRLPAALRDYVDAQEYGFSAGGFRPDQEVAGMHMIAHLRYYMRDRVDLALDRAERRVLDGL